MSKIKKALKSEWALVNPTLELGVTGIETDTGRRKVGLGMPWSQTVYDAHSAYVEKGALMFDGEAVTEGSLRQCATGCRIPTASGGLLGGFKHIYGRKLHFAEQDMFSWVVEDVNWWARPNVAEVGSGGAMSIQRSFEYPIGSPLQRITYDDENVGVIADGGSIVSDPVAVLIPKGAAFFTQFDIVAPAGVLLSQAGNGAGGFYASAAGERCGYDTGTVAGDVMAPIVADYGGGMVCPAAIASIHSGAAGGFVGDSRTYGQGDSFANTAFAQIGYVERALGQFVGHINVGVAGETASNFKSANRSKSRDLVRRYCTHVFSDFGNDILGGQSADQLLASHYTLRDYFSPAKYIPATVMPVTTSTDGWATTANQTVGATEAVRVDFNAKLNWSGKFVAITRPAERADAGGGKWLPFYTADGIHPSDFGAGSVANSGFVNPGLLA